MKEKLARPAGDLEQVMDAYGNMLFRLCIVMLGNSADAEDALQETMFKYYRKAPAFTDEEHKKAWLLTVVGNQCKDMLRFRAKHPLAEDTDIYEYKSGDNENSGILDALMALPEKFRLVLILYYVEEYPVKDIARMVGKTPSAVKMRLQKGRKLLEEVYRKEYL
ncbi:MAG: RNA polymerase sigma factor [Lachnospiraceae bacterium]|nr:RNA polymerase sigma factor [Lachnospiraceae bacterium]